MKKTLKCHSRYGAERWETDLGDDWYQVEGPSHYIRCGGLDELGAKIANPDSLGFVDFDGGPFYEIGSSYQPGAEQAKLAHTKAWDRPGVIVELQTVDTDQTNYAIVKIKIRKNSIMSSFKVNAWDKRELAEFKTIMQVALKDLLETLAKQEHDQWMEWAKTLMEKEPGLSPERVARWKAYMVPYNELTDDVKEFDRIWARKTLNLFLDSMAAQRLEDLVRNNKDQQELIDNLQSDIQRMLKEHRDITLALENANDKLTETLEQLQEDVKKLFTGALDKTTLAGYISSTEPQNGS